MKESRESIGDGGGANVVNGGEGFHDVGVVLSAAKFSHSEKVQSSPSTGSWP